MDNDFLYDRALASYLGLAVGDALGATVEFMQPREIAFKYGVHKNIIGGGWLKLKAGSVTDDTEMSLALGRALLASGGWNASAVADAFVEWLKSRPVDIGNTCRRGIQRYMQDGSLSGPPNEGDAGNGAAMRNLPLVLLTLNNEQAFVEHTLAQCHFTHHHPLSDAATLTLGRLLRVLLNGGKLKECREVVNQLLHDFPIFQFSPYPRHASAYIVDTLQTVLYHLFSTDSFESLLINTVNCGEDADTTGAIAGMLGGALYGLNEIPERWLEKLELHVVSEIEMQVGDLLRLAGISD
jgi:ADP-ribosyl-[dinitrogen reductase] hydrolase